MIPRVTFLLLGICSLLGSQQSRPSAHSQEIKLDKYYSLKIVVSSRGFVRCDIAPSHTFRMNDDAFDEADWKHALRDLTFQKFLANIPPECSLGKERQRAPVGIHGAGKVTWTDHYENGVLRRTTVGHDRVLAASIYPFREVTGVITSPSQCDLNSNSVVSLEQVSLCSIDIDGLLFYIPEDHTQLRSNGQTVTILAAGPFAGSWSLAQEEPNQPSAHSREIKLDKYYSLKIFVSSRGYVRCDIAPTRIFKPGVDRFDHEDRKHALKAAKFYEYLSKVPQECSIGNIVKPSRAGVAGGGKLFLTDGYQQGLLERALVGSDGRILFAEIYPLRPITGVITRRWQCDLGEAGCTVYIDGFRFFVPKMMEDLQHEGRSVSLLAAGPVGGGWALAQDEPRQSFE
jgi:hypothetical protein